METPSDPVGDGLPAAGRDPAGRFASGNRFSKGNPYAKRVGELRSAMLAAVTDDDWRAIIEALVREAKAGESWAVKEIMDRTLGKPQEADLIERIEQLETLTARWKDTP